jgi:hypothetical protein
MSRVKHCLARNTASDEVTMAKIEKRTSASTVSVPILAMMIFAIAGALLVGASFQVIIFWPQPVAVAPYFEDSLFATGAVWGLVVCGSVGWLIGWLTDENHFTDTKYE